MDQYSKMHNDSLGKVILLAIFFLSSDNNSSIYIKKKITRNILTTFCYFTQEDAIN